MNMRDIEKTHPALFEAMYLIAADSGLPREHWTMDDRWRSELDALEAKARTFQSMPNTSEDFKDETEWLGYPTSELTTFAVGEYSEQRALMEMHDALRLSWFLNCFFGEVEWCEPGTEMES